jgi:hypothetical protein
MTEGLSDQLERENKYRGTTTTKKKNEANNKRTKGGGGGNKQAINLLTGQI